MLSWRAYHKQMHIPDAQTVVATHWSHRWWTSWDHQMVLHAEANEQLNYFAKVLEGRDVSVDRPTPFDFNAPVSTPDWENPASFGCMPPRDVILTVGKEMLEATMSYRSRFFEYLCYRPLLQKYFEDDPQFRHVSAPKPRMTDASYRPDYLSDKIGDEKRLK